MADKGKLPLAGKRIVVTRAAGQAGELVQELEERGAEVLLLPLLRFAPPEDWGPADKALLALNSFEAVLFLSANAVRFVFERCRSIGSKFIAGQRVLIAAVGPATERAILNQECRVDYVAHEHTGAALVGELKEALAGRAVLLPRSDRGKRDISIALQEIGARVTEIVVYRTETPELVDGPVAKQIWSDEVDLAIFASPSAVDHFVVAFSMHTLIFKSRRLQFAAIGPTTARALREADLSVAIEALESSTSGLVAAIENYFARTQ